MKRLTLLLAVPILLAAAACQESSITGTYGSASLQGKVVMSGDLTGTEPSGIEVRVPGTGITTMTDSEGRFELAGLPEGDVEILFLRGDGIDASRTVSTQAQAITVELTSRRGRGRPVAKPGDSIHGSILEIFDSSILVDSVRNGQIEIYIDESTFIYKGAVTLLISDLEVGNEIHARAAQNEEEQWVAQTIAVVPRHAGDRRFLPRSAVGAITSLGENMLTVLTEEGVEVIVRIDERTDIYTKNQVLEFSDLEVGNRVKVFGVKLEDESLLASWIRVKPNEGEDDDGDEEDDELSGSVHGEVLSVGDTSLVVEAEEGNEVTVNVDDSTEIKKRGKAISFADIQPGNKVTAVGERVDETTLNARKIRVTG